MILCNCTKMSRTIFEQSYKPARDQITPLVGVKEGGWSWEPNFPPINIWPQIGPPSNSEMYKTPRWPSIKDSSENQPWHERHQDWSSKGRRQASPEIQLDSNRVTIWTFQRKNQKRNSNCDLTESLQTQSHDLAAQPCFDFRFFKWTFGSNWPQPHWSTPDQT